MTANPTPDRDGQGEPAELRSLPREVRQLMHAVDRMRDDWLESGPQRCQELMQGVYDACDAVWNRPAVVSSPPATDRATLRDLIADTVTPFLANFSDDETARVNAGEVTDAVLAVLPEDGRAALARVERLALTFEVSGNEFIAEQIRAAVGARQPDTETRGDCCGAPPPELFIDEVGREWHAGDCWCTLPPDHDGQHRCQPCTDRVGAPGWGDGTTAAGGAGGVADETGEADHG